MKIQNIKYDYTGRNRYSSDYSNPRSGFKEKCNAGLCGGVNNNEDYSVTFSGSGSESNDAAAKSFLGKLKKLGLKSFDWLTEFTGNHNVASASLIALFLAGMLRPAITVSLPGENDRDDKIYAAGHSMASALIGFAFSTLLTTPLDSGCKYIVEDAKKVSADAFEKYSKNAEWLEDYKRRHNGKTETRKLDKKYFLSIVSDKVDEINKLRYQYFETKDVKLLTKISELERHIAGIDVAMKNVSDWVIAIPRSMLTIALIPPILKYVFHLEKKSKAAKVQEQQPQQAQQNINISNPTSSSKTPRVAMKDFLGGNK